jgi:ribonuclease R
VKIRLDEHGRVARIEKVENDVSHQLIEECMLLANEAVAARLMSLAASRGVPRPRGTGRKALAEYREEVLSHNVPCGNLSQRAEVQKLLAQARHAAHRPGAQDRLPQVAHACPVRGRTPGALRAGEEDTRTSPRRSAATPTWWCIARCSSKPRGRGALKETADHLSITERNSADAERDSKDVKMFAFLNAQLESGRNPSVSGAGHGRAELRLLRGRAGAGDERVGAVVDARRRLLRVRRRAQPLVGRRTRRVIRLGDPADRAGGQGGPLQEAGGLRSEGGCQQSKSKARSRLPKPIPLTQPTSAG